jgi:hypothetical protein
VIAFSVTLRLTKTFRIRTFRRPWRCQPTWWAGDRSRTNLWALSRHPIEHIESHGGHTSCRCDGVLPLRTSFGADDPQGGSGNEVALKVEGVVNRRVHAEEALGSSS